MAATGFDAVYDRRLVGFLWLVTAAVFAMMGMLCLRSAEGFKLLQVNGGALYKRAFVLAKATNTPLKRVGVIPAGKGHLTNAYGGSQTIAVTDNYGKVFTSAQLDFVIGHELAHTREKHGHKRFLITAAVFACIALVVFSLSPILARFRPLLDISVIFVPILTFYFLSRRFEYAADAAAVVLTRDPGTAIHALISLYRINGVPMDRGRLTELFMTHPTLARRAQAIGEKGGMSFDQVREVIADSEPKRRT